MDEAKTIGLNDPPYSEIVDFLYKEAELMDEGRFSNWLELMTEDLIYRMPMRVNRGRGEQPDYSDREPRMRLRRTGRQLCHRQCWKRAPRPAPPR